MNLYLQLDTVALIWIAIMTSLFLMVLSVEIGACNRRKTTSKENIQINEIELEKDKSKVELERVKRNK